MGRDGGRKGLWQLGLDAVQKVCELIDEYQIDCELGSGNLHLAAKLSHAEELQEELEHLESQYDYRQLSYLAPTAVAERTSARGFYGALLDDGRRHLHPLKYAVGLARAAAEAGSEFTSTVLRSRHPTASLERSKRRRAM